jgi:hypothetical protein
MYIEGSLVGLLRVKVKLNLSLCLNNWAQCHEDLGDVEVITIFISTLDGGEWFIG